MTLSLQQINWTINFHGLKPSESKCKRWLSPTVTLLRTLGTECRAMHAGGAGGGGEYASIHRSLCRKRSVCFEGGPFSICFFFFDVKQATSFSISA